jgi:replication factor A1
MTYPPNSSFDSLDETRKKLITKLSIVKKALNSKAGNSKILSILQDNSCRLRCKHLIGNGAEVKIDPFYTAKHDYIRKKLIDAIVTEFGDLVTVKSEDFVSFGKLDIEVQFDNTRIVVEYGRKTIAIEIKTGHSVKSDHFFQIERYLIDVDVLIRIRVPTEDVVVIYNTFIKDVLIKDLKRLTLKADEIISDKRIIVPGDWCKGCNAICPYRKPRENNSHNASFKDHEDVIKHVDVVIEKTLAELKKLRKQNILPEDEIMGPEQRLHTNIGNNEEGQTEITNGNGKGKTADTKTPISQLKPNMNGLSIEGKVTNIAKPRTVNTKTGGSAQVADAIISDETGRIKLSLWDEQINSINEEDNVTIKKGYTKEYLGEIILYISKYGTLTKH